MIRKNTRLFALFIGSLFLMASARADWVLDSEKSALSFGSIKKEDIGESHSFESLNGQISEDGALNLVIDLSSVETWVDIRNDRMREFLFQVTEFPVARLSGQIDLTPFAALAIGESQMTEARFTLDLHGHQQPLEAELVVVRLGTGRVLVVPQALIFIDMEKFDLLAGLEKLKDLAKLPTISSSVPVSFHLIFNHIVGEQ